MTHAEDDPAWEAGYDNLTPAQEAEFTRLMSVPANTWPEELIKHVRATGGPFCGDALAGAVGGWVKDRPERGAR